MTVTENIQLQKRFFCENCKREVFLNNRFCDGCGGEIQWPDAIRKVLSTWVQETKGKWRLRNPTSMFHRQKQ